MCRPSALPHPEERPGVTGSAVAGGGVQPRAGLQQVRLQPVLYCTIPYCTVLSRFAYSRICTDLASHGWVVAATEHRDGSAALSFTMERGHKIWIQHRRVADGEKEYSVRNGQV